MASDLNSGLSKKSILGLQVWELIAILIGALIVFCFGLAIFCLTKLKRARKIDDRLPLSRIPAVSKEIKEVRVQQLSTHDRNLPSLQEKFGEVESNNSISLEDKGKLKYGGTSRSGSFRHTDGAGSQSGEEGGSGTFKAYKPASSYPLAAPSPLNGLPEFSHLGWGHWFTLRDLEIATNRFSKENILGEGGYGVVYRGQLINGTPVAVKRILNNL